MKAKSTLAKNLEIVDSKKVLLDSVCKRLLANKSILAWILKTCIEEYAEYSPQEIERKYIEDIPRVAQDALHRDETVENIDYIQGGSSEDSSMIINVESQSDFYPGYPLPKRGIYYGKQNDFCAVWYSLYQKPL